MNEDEIDDELKCAICHQPFREPVSSIQCHHTFCKVCINACLNRERLCPICRTYSNHERYQPVKSRALLNQLNRLRVRCDACQAKNIQHDDFQGHTQNCPNWVIPCTAADIRCAWRGMRNQLDNHVRICPFQHVRPIVDHLQRQIDDLRNKQLFLFIFVVFAIFFVLMLSKSEQSKQPRSFGDKFRGFFED
jgi:hypothetical protein